MTSKTLRATVLAVSATLTAAVLAPAAQASAPPGIAWGPCPAGTQPLPDGKIYQCATFDVPMSYRDPGGAQIRLALGLLPATDQAHKLGTIFYNPGGPGAPGRFAPELTPELTQRYDIIGFDPRGVGGSTTIQCFTDPAQLGRLAGALGQFPITPEQERAQLADAQAVTDLCEANTGPLANHLSTAYVARDLDRLRAAVGEPKLRYYGKSYGSYLGETYANLFGNRVGAMALDAVDDPVNWSTGYRPGDAKAPMSYRLGGYTDTQHALESFLRACEADNRCAFREPGTDLTAKYDRLLDRLATGPVTVDGQPIRYQDVISRTHAGLTDAANSTTLARFLDDVSKAPAAGATESKTAVTPTITTGYDSMLGGGATLCSDSVNPDDPAAWARYAQAADRSGRGFGSYDVYKSLPCATWRVSDADRYAGPWNRPTAAPILLLANSQGDPETPYAGAQRAEKLLANARLLTLDSFGHGARGKSACIDDRLNAYFEHGRLPAPGTVCAPDRTPFG